MEDKTLDKIVILAKLCAINDMQGRLLDDKKELEAKLQQLEKNERESNHN